MSGRDPIVVTIAGSRPAEDGETEARLVRWSNWAALRGFELGRAEAYGRVCGFDVILYLPPVGRYVLPVRFAVWRVDRGVTLSEQRAHASDATAELFAAVPDLLKLRIESGVAYCSLDADASGESADVLLEALSPWREGEGGYR